MRKLNTPRAPVVVTSVAVAQHLGTIIVDVPVTDDGNGDGGRLDETRAGITFEINEVQADSRFISAKSITLMRADWSAELTAAVRQLRAALMAAADAAGELEAGNDDEEFRER